MKNSIRIVTNILMDNQNEASGIHRYQEEIFKNLKNQLPREVCLHSTVLLPSKRSGITQLDSLLNGFIDYPLKIRRELEDQEVLHIFTHHFAYLLLGLKHENTIVTCFDMIPLVRGWEHTWVERRLFSLYIKGIKKAKKIITISNWTKNEIVKFLGISEEIITVVPYGIDRSIYYPDKKKGERFREKMGISKSCNLILYVGSEQPRKNLETLTAALSLLKKTGQKFVFIKVGRPQWINGRKKFIKQIYKHDLQDITKIIDYATENSHEGYEDLTGIYNAADIFLFPSIHEGFGLPPLEATACGVPVIASNSTSIPEVMGDGAILLPHADPKIWFDSISLLLNSPDEREKLCNKGFLNVGKYDWRNSAEILKNVYMN